ncbi:ABC transporter permease [Olivibacter sp. XZL3]|uniref:ABC transporter permease n=1 Tax=Olivibacter sp. XZL3 TaxID=1735116 RepID=UPI00141708F6|nr:ABC transporter permease [Olivibacter sp. XZL3]
MFSAIHIFGLGLAFAASLLLFLTATFELSFDNFHARTQDLYQTYYETHTQEGKEVDPAMPVPFAELAKQEIPAIEHLTRYGIRQMAYRVGEKEVSLSSRFIDPDFFEMFNFKLLSGSITSFEQPGHIVLSQHTAKTLFGEEDVIGKTLEINRGDNWEQATVSAIIEDAPRNSTLDVSVLMRFQDFPQYQELKDNWNAFNHSAFVRLHPGTSPKTFARQSKLFNEKYLREDIDNLKRDGAKADENGAYLALNLLSIKDIHFSDKGLGSGINPFYPWMLFSVAVLILFIASSNFVNLSLASSFNRAREIGMRKTLGAWTYQLMLQLWGEAAIISLIALGFGLLLSLFLLSPYNALMGYHLVMRDLFSWRNGLTLMGSFSLVTLLAGGYPAWTMARINTLSILKGKLQTNTGYTVRKAFTIGQFGIAFLLIIITLIVSKQLNYLHHKPLGFNQSEVISIPIGNAIAPDLAINQLRAELSSFPEVESISASYINMGKGNDGRESTSTSNFDYEGRQVYTHKRRVDFDYLKTLGLALLEGRDFSRGFSTDSNAVIINEKMATQLGGKNLIGKNISLYGDNTKIIGIVKDFNFESLHARIEPMTLHMNSQQGNFRYIFVRINPGNLSSSMALITDVWKKVNPKATDMPSFLQENTDRIYKREQQFSHILISGSILAITIACLGLFALALLMTNQRSKEITVHKILGARHIQLIFLLSKDFLKLIGISFIIATPLSWWMMNRWLQDFAYRIDIQANEFLYAGILVLFIAGLTIATQSIKAALANPVDSLRNE